MTYLIISFWPRLTRFPSLALAIAYQPPMRARRKAPPSIRTASIDEGQTAQLAALFASLPTGEAR